MCLSYLHASCVSSLRVKHSQFIQESSVLLPLHLTCRCRFLPINIKDIKSMDQDLLESVFKVEGTPLLTAHEIIFQELRMICSAEDYDFRVDEAVSHEVLQRLEAQCPEPAPGEPTRGYETCPILAQKQCRRILRLTSCSQRLFLWCRCFG